MGGSRASAVLTALSICEAHTAARAQARLAVSTRARLHTDSKMAKTRLPNPSGNPPGSCCLGERSAPERSHRSASAPTSLPLRRRRGSGRGTTALAIRQIEAGSPDRRRHKAQCDRSFVEVVMAGAGRPRVVESGLRCGARRRRRSRAGPYLSSDVGLLGVTGMVLLVSCTSTGWFVLMSPRVPWVDRLIPMP